jgi:hypothetical protein
MYMAIGKKITNIYIDMGKKGIYGSMGVWGRKASKN